MATGAIDPKTGKPYKDKREVSCHVPGCRSVALYLEYGRALCSPHRQSVGTQGCRRTVFGRPAPRHGRTAVGQGTGRGLRRNARRTIRFGFATVADGTRAIRLDAWRSRSARRTAVELPRRVRRSDRSTHRPRRTGGQRRRAHTRVGGRFVRRAALVGSPSVSSSTSNSRIALPGSCGNSCVADWDTALLDSWSSPSSTSKMFAGLMSL